jgi:hypothetical protein
LMRISRAVPLVNGRYKCLESLLYLIFSTPMQPFELSARRRCRTGFEAAAGLGLARQ